MLWESAFVLAAHIGDDNPIDSSMKQTVAHLVACLFTY